MVGQRIDENNQSSCQLRYTTAAFIYSLIKNKSLFYICWSEFFERLITTCATFGKAAWPNR